MTETTDHQILCNACKVPPKPIPDSKPEEWGCGVCGVHDTRENIIREAKDHAIEMASRHVQDSARKAAGSSRFIKFSGKPIPHGDYRFVTDFKLAS